jgi:oleate hydratase
LRNREEVPQSAIHNAHWEDCTGEEITQEWLYHMGVSEEDISTLSAEAAKCVPVMMPYVTSFFMPREAGDRPAVMPKGSKKIAFIGQFAETTPDTIFTTEDSVRTAMESLYQLASLNRRVSEVYDSTYNIRCLLGATAHLRDGKEFGA